MPIGAVASPGENMPVESDVRLTSSHPQGPRRSFRLALFDRAEQGPGVGLSLREILVDWSILAVVVLTFCTAFLDFNDARILPGNEADVIQTLDWTLVNSLTRFGQFPLWNPYLRTGFPYVADPFLHIYNPLSTLPVLIFGVWDGFKIALFLSFVAAALGMWWMGAVLGVGRPARLWMGLMYAFTGQAVARFFQGEYDFVLGFAWIPWVLALALLTMRTRQQRYALAASVALALLFFSGNVYYAFYMVFVIPLLALVSALEVDWPARRVRWRRSAFVLIAVIVLLAAGLTAIQWLPMVNYWNTYTKASDPELIGSHSPYQIWLDYVSKDHHRPDARKTLPPEEFYAYTGIWPFLLLIFVPLAFRSGRHREQIFLVLLLAVSIAYIATKYMPWAQLYRTSSLLNQFRYQTRMLIYGAVALIGLAGCGLNAVWARAVVPTKLTLVSVPAVVRWAIRRIGTGLLIMFIVWSVMDVYRTNQRHMQMWERHQPHYEVIEWLQQYDSSVYYVSTNQGGWHGALFANGMRYLDAWYGFEPVLPLKGAINARLVRARPKYMALGNDQAPDQPYELVRRFAQYSVWRMPRSLPFAFVVPNTLLMDSARGTELTATEVRPVEPTSATSNWIAVQAEGVQGESLVVLASAYHGWQVKVDGHPAVLSNVGGYLAVPLQEGMHRYVFTFSPVSFWVGLVLSATTAAGLTALMIMGRRSRRRRFRVQATYATGMLRPSVPLDLPDETPVYVALEVQSSLPTPEARRPAQRDAAQQLPLTAPPGTHPWQLPTWQAVFFLLFVAAVGIILFLRLFKLEWLQSEIYGDIMIVRNYVAGVLAGRWPTRFDLSAGPLYHYLIAPIVALVGLDYVGLKVASVIVSLAALMATYLLCRELVDDYFALLATFIAGVSSWLLVFSRLGNSQIISPLLAAIVLWLAVRFVKFHRQRELIACAVVSALGLYVYPQLFILPGVAFVTLLLLRWTGFAVSTRALGIFIAVGLICAIPFVFIVRADPANFTVGYVGSKIRPEGGDLLFLVAHNTVKALLALHVRGDEIFRSNPPGLPHLDPISGVLFLAGTLYWLTDRERRRWTPLWLAPFLLLQAPSILAVNQPREVPSASRTLAITPIVYMLVASGLWWLIGELRRRLRQMIAPAVVLAVLLVAILALNVERYFKEYLDNLPYGDIPIGRLIANYADSLPADTHVYMVGCCWIYSIPDRFVDKEVARPQNWHYLEPNQLSCTQLQYLKLPAVLIWSFRDALPAPQLASCQHWLPAQLYTYRGKPTFRAAPLRPDLPPQQAAPEVEATARKGLEATLIELDGQQVDLVYSRLDMGSPADMFDGNRATLARGLEANPFVLEFVFSEPRPIAGLSADFAHMDFVITARVYGDGDAEGRTYTLEYRDRVPDEPHIEMAFEDAPPAVRKLRLEILQLNPPLDVHIHVREIKLRWLP